MLRHHAYIRCVPHRAAAGAVEDRVGEGIVRRGELIQISLEHRAASERASAYVKPESLAMGTMRPFIQRLRIGFWVEQDYCCEPAV